MNEVNHGLLTEAQEMEIAAIAREEKRPPAEGVEAMLKVYRLRRLSEYGRAKAKETGMKAKSPSHAERLVGKAIDQTRKAHGQ
ncbi:MAG: hypothetical protein ABI612_26950 [Betaproteobacteria bacterium]